MIILIFLMCAVILVALVALFFQRDIYRILKRSRHGYVFIRTMTPVEGTTIDVFITRVYQGHSKTHTLTYNQETKSISSPAVGPYKLSSLDLNDLQDLGIQFEQTDETVEIIHQIRIAVGYMSN